MVTRLEVMRKSPDTRLRKSPVELHYGRKPNAEIRNLLKLEKLEKLTLENISAKPDTLRVYSINGVVDMTAQFSPI